jgi:hypothetical protein
MTELQHMVEGDINIKVEWTCREGFMTSSVERLKYD